MQISDGLSARLRAAREFRSQGFVRFVCGSNAIGWIRRDQTGRLRTWPGVFECSEENIRLRPTDETALSVALAEVTQALARDGAVKGWRGESYAVHADGSSAVLFHVERAAMRFFGLTSSAAHLNGFILATEIPTIWIARRSATKAIDPGMLDTLVAGGVPSGEDAWQTLLRECSEEAGISPALAEKARRAGVLEVCREVPEGLHREILHVHELALPADFIPRNMDGEVSEFLSLDPKTLLEQIAHGEMTVEAGLVTADFAMRHGMIRDEDGQTGAAIETCRAPTLP